jgi:hypothetical protein
LSCLYQSTKGAVRSDQMILTDDLIEGAGTEQLREWRRFTQALADGVVKERRGSRSFGGRTKV